MEESQVRLRGREQKSEPTKRTSDTGLLDVDEVRLEHALGRLEALRADLDDTAVGELRAEGERKRWREGRGREEAVSVEGGQRGRQGRAHLVVLNEGRRLLA